MTPGDLAASAWPTIEATVPGNVELDLLSAGKIAEPSVGNNVYALGAYESYRWWYRRTFSTPSVPAGQRVILEFAGLDCLGTIFVNGRRIGDTANMLIGHRFDVTAVLTSQGDNELDVRIDSAVLAGRVPQPQAGEWAMTPLHWESLAIRKAPHMYGWDIMPRIVSAGLWREVSLLIQDPMRWRDVYWATLATHPAQHTATLCVDWDFTTSRCSLSGLRVRLVLSRHGRVAHQSEYPVCGTHDRVQIHLDKVHYWWPRGMGEPALYEARAELLDGSGCVLATHTTAVGIRTIQLRRTEVTTPQEPGEFLFVVNDQPVFIKGTNWVPLDALHSRDSQKLAAVLGMLVDLNCNMVRCWGGNVYEDHAFFDFCDRYGIMVWQDFALACHIYPQTDEFAEQMRQEAQAVVIKLRNHPSLALWAGNNEIDEAYRWSGLKLDPNTDRLSRQVLPEVVRRRDPLRAYLPSSPCRSPALVAAGNHDHLKPEDHLWGPRDDFKGPYYTDSPAHFASEIGYHGCPERASLAQMLDPDHLWPWQDNDQWLTHAVRPAPQFTGYDYRIPLMAKQIEVLFGQVPQELDDFILASQISQAEALKFFIERFRQGKFRRTGIIWWNLRDGWPIISDAVVDYYNRRKLAYYYIQRVQADVCPIMSEAVEGRHRLVIVNDTPAAVSGGYQVADADSGQVLAEGRCTVDADGLTRTDGILSAPTQPAFWLLRWSSAQGTAVNHYLAGPRPYALSTYTRWLSKLNLPRSESVALPQGVS